MAGVDSRNENRAAALRSRSRNICLSTRMPSADWAANGRDINEYRTDYRTGGGAHGQALRDTHFEVARALRVAAGALVLTSPQRRAVETAAVVGRVLGLPVRECPGLREQSHGEWEGRPAAGC